MRLKFHPMYLHKLSFNSSYQDTVLADIFTGNMLITRERQPGPGHSFQNYWTLSKLHSQDICIQCSVVKASLITPEIGHRLPPCIIITLYFAPTIIIPSKNNWWKVCLQKITPLTVDCDKILSPPGSRSHSGPPQSGALYGSNLWSPLGQSTFFFIKKNYK